MNRPIRTALQESDTAAISPSPQCPDVQSDVGHSARSLTLDIAVRRQGQAVAAPSCRSTRPRVSIVIPTHRRPLSLRRLLWTLIDQTCPAEAMEIIVAQDGNDAKTEAVIKEIRNVSSICIKHQRHEAGSAAATRNLGASAAEGEYLLFVDDDCEVDRQWVERTVAVLESHPEIGQVACRIVGVSSKFFARCHDYARYYPSMQRSPGERKFACGCAFGMRRALFNELGGFNQRVATGEDEDLGLRMQTLGYGAVYRPECLVYHNHGRHSFRALIRHARTWAARGEVELHLNHASRSTYGRFASSNPYFYLLFSPFIAGLVTLRVWYHALREPRMPLYLPFIYCDKVVWCWSTFQYLKRKRSGL